MKYVIVKRKPLPKPVKRDSRICFSIAFFASEDDALLYAEDVKKRGCTYNGGYFHGMACGRNNTFDHVDPEHGQLFAVTE
jgi:hypothetical protein